MKMSEIGFSFANLRKSIGPVKVREFYLPCTEMVDACRADDSTFCQETVASGILTESQMRHAAERYRLGKSRNGKCIFWMINEKGSVLDGRIDSTIVSFDDALPIWISQMLKARDPELLSFWQPSHCLFGLHLIPPPEGCGVPLRKHSWPTAGCGVPLRKHSARGGTTSQDVFERNITALNRPVALVESERSAVILSELFPQFTWLATISNLHFTLNMLEPLKGRKVVIYPPTDTTGSNYLFWYDIADRARKRYHLDISVSYLLEDQATPQQKEAGIDLVGYLFSNA